MTLHFHDVSHYQANYQPDGPTIAKASEGTSYTDSSYATTKQRTLAGGWPFLGYHFLRHGNVPAQVNHAAAVVGSNQPLMLDVESATDGTFPTLAEMFAFMDAWPGVVSLCYIPKWFWAGKWGSPNLTSITDRGAGLISSRYTTYSDTGPGWDSYGGVAPIIWQYTSTPIDTNAFKGTEAELGQLFAHGIAGGDDMADSPNVKRAGLFADALVRDAAQFGDGTSGDGGYPDKDGFASTSLFWAAVERHAREAVAEDLAAMKEALARIEAALAAGSGSTGANITLTFPETQITGTATS